MRIALFALVVCLFLAGCSSNLAVLQQDKANAQALVDGATRNIAKLDAEVKVLPIGTKQRAKVQDVLDQATAYLPFLQAAVDFYNGLINDYIAAHAATTTQPSKG